MKILMTADTVSGVWTYAIELTRALGEQGVEVTLATMGAVPTAEQRAQALALKNLSLRTSDYKVEWMDDPWSDVDLAAKWLLWLEQEVQPDLIHLNGYVHGSLPWKVPVVMVGHSCALSMWSAINDCPAPSAWDHYSHEVAKGLHAADIVLCPSKTMLRSIESHYGPIARSKVIYNFRYPKAVRPRRKEEFILAGSRVLDKAGNIQMLEDVAPKLDWPVFVAGDQETTETPMPDYQNIRILAHDVPRGISNWFARASIYAHPARYEPFGFAELDAGLAGCALVLGDIPTLREIWQDAAIFIPPDDAEALEGALQSLISDEAHRKELADRASARAQAYNPKNAAKGYLEVYNKLLKSKVPEGRTVHV